MFGLPVIALQHFGLRLGGEEAALWVGLMQMILAGWIMYVSAAGMLVEGFLLRKPTADSIVALSTMLLYLASAAGWARLLLQHSQNSRTFWFDIAVIVLIIWCGARFWWLGSSGERHGSAQE